MKFLKQLDGMLFKAVQVCLGVAMIALTSIVVLQVLVRYVFHVSIGGVEELPVYLMLVSVWIAAIFVAKNDGHVKIELLDMFVKNKKIVGVVNIILCGLSGVALGYFAYLSLQYMFKLQRYGDVSAGLGFPIWILVLVMVISCAMMAMYYFINFVKKIIQFKEEGRA